MSNRGIPIDFAITIFSNVGLKNFIYAPLKKNWNIGTIKANTLFCKSHTVEIIVIALIDNTLNATRSIYIPTKISTLLAQSLIKNITPFRIMYAA